MSPPTLEELAEDAYAFLPVQRPARLVERDDVVLRLMPVPIPEASMVLRPRLRPAQVGPTLEDVRAWLRADGRSACIWWLGPNATPEDLGAQLLDLGLRPYEKDPVYAGMTLESEPPPVADVEIRAVRTLEDLQVFAETMRDGWGIPEEVHQQGLAVARAAWPEFDHALVTRWVAFVDGEPFGTAVSQYVGDAVYLGGAAVMPDARGRGVYRALLRKRWEDGRERRARALVIQAGAMSRPIVERLGFTYVCEVRVYVDEF